MQDGRPDITPLLRQRLSLGLSRAEVARRVGLDPATIWRCETGRVAPRRSTVLLLAAALDGCDPATIFPPEKTR